MASSLLIFERPQVPGRHPFENPSGGRPRRGALGAGNEAPVVCAPMLPAMCPRASMGVPHRF